MSKHSFKRPTVPTEYLSRRYPFKEGYRGRELLFRSIALIVMQIALLQDCDDYVMNLIPTLVLMFILGHRLYVDKFKVKKAPGSFEAPVCGVKFCVATLLYMYAQYFDIYYFWRDGVDSFNLLPIGVYMCVLLFSIYKNKKAKKEWELKSLDGKSSDKKQTFEIH